ncbi:MAG TPA: 2-oxoacid:ferredoxin oxidoreductase subunit beta [Anaeromyxobacteraceae bacterium]|jgi:2-oxoglutarate ferredoxin oxidoreductase subunit beta|nr:2-oxoacid:ferredoxin oxidoreductase subunit beta [Anaeromyxobacteraceae bacterium]
METTNGQNGSTKGALPLLTKKDFESGVDPRWCPGCGDFSIINQVQKLMPNVGVPREKIVFISGIGCSSRFPYYMNNYGMHTLHGRAPSFASGLKISRPDLMVWVVTGDGDALAIGGNHFIHVMRRNMDIKLVMFNNRIYGLTKGQVSPTSELGKKTKTTPYGSPDYPFNPPALALGAGATFVARAVDVEGVHMGQMLKAAADHKGSAYVEVYQNCPVFNDGAYTYMTEKAVRAESILRMEQGKPLLFGKDNKKGIRFNPQTVHLEVVTLGENGITEKDILVHDATHSDPTIAFMLANLTGKPGFPTPIGVFRDVRLPTCDELTWQQIEEVTAKKGQGTLEKLLTSGETWTVK